LYILQQTTPITAFWEVNYHFLSIYLFNHAHTARGYIMAVYYGMTRTTAQPNFVANLQ